MPRRRLLSRLVSLVMERALRTSFRRILWVGEPPELPAGVPVVLYANHHNFYDGYLLWVVVTRMLGRPGTTWMADWDRFPFFAAGGAQPFPPDDPARRAATVRRTIRRLRSRPATVLVYFPEGRLHAPEEGVLPFDADLMRRLDRLLPEKLWWPVAIHVTWRGEALPTALLTGGTPHASIRGDEQTRLGALWQRLRTTPPGTEQVLMEGPRSPQESWNFSFLRRAFERYL